MTVKRQRWCRHWRLFFFGRSRRPFPLLRGIYLSSVDQEGYLHFYVVSIVGRSRTPFSLLRGIYRRSFKNAISTSTWYLYIVSSTVNSFLQCPKYSSSTSALVNWFGSYWGWISSLVLCGPFFFFFLFSMIRSYVCPMCFAINWNEIWVINYVIICVQNCVKQKSVRA